MTENPNTSGADLLSKSIPLSLAAAETPFAAIALIQWGTRRRRPASAGDSSSRGRGARKVLLLDGGWTQSPLVRWKQGLEPKWLRKLQLLLLSPQLLLPPTHSFLMAAVMLFFVIL